VAVAAVRGKMTNPAGLLDAFYDIFGALKLDRDQYCKRLSAAPEEIARRLTWLAEQGSKD
jgi:hypothetical protein